MEKNKFTFKKIMLILAVVLSFGCIIGWAKLADFADNFEKSMQTQQEEILTENTDINEEYEEEILDGEIGEDFKKLSLEVAESYAKFTSADLKFSEIEGYFQKGSDILELLETYNSNRYNNHEKSYFENIEVLQPVITKDGTIKCQVSFEYIVLTSQDTHNFPSNYVIYFSQDDKKVVSLEMG